MSEAHKSGLYEHAIQGFHFELRLDVDGSQPQNQASVRLTNELPSHWIAELNGVDVLMLQEVETGRLASYGVDQVLWLARRLNMEAAFFPQNEVLQGIAVLSRVPIEEVWGVELPSESNQAAMMKMAVKKWMRSLVATVQRMQRLKAPRK